MKEFFKSPRRIIAIVGCVLLLSSAVIFNLLFNHFENTIRIFFGGVEVYWESERMQLALEQSGNLAEEIAREGILLLHNENVGGRPALPLSEAEIANGNINVFGWRGSGFGFSPSTSQREQGMRIPHWVGENDAIWNGGWIMSGSGSGMAVSGVAPVRLLDALSYHGFNWNRQLMDIARAYREFIPSGWGAGWDNLLNSHPNRFFRIWEPPVTDYNPTVMANALAHSDIAMVVIGRLGGEGRDIPTIQMLADRPSGAGTPGTEHFVVDGTRHYLQLSEREEELLEHIANGGFRKTIVVMNTCNHFEMDFLNDPRFNIDAAISVGALGTRGALAIPEILKGYRYNQTPVYENGERVMRYVYATGSGSSGRFLAKGEEGGERVLVERGIGGQVLTSAQEHYLQEPVFSSEREYFSPSGRTVNTWVRRMEYDPVFLLSGQNYTHIIDGTGLGARVRANVGHHGAIPHTSPGVAGDNYIDYEEGIFMGYRYFETRAYEERRINPNSTWYRDHVQFPFGFGLSYTEFEWEVYEVLADGVCMIENNITVTRTTQFEVSVNVTNTGNWPGQDVVQIYINAPFHRNNPHIEGPLPKAHVVLVDFAKTSILQPRESRLLTMKFDAYSFASYDAYNQAMGRTDTWDGGFVLEQGQYNIFIQHNSHDIANIDDAIIPFYIPSTIVFDQYVIVRCERGGADRILEPARNRFTGVNAEAGIPLDGRAGYACPRTGRAPRTAGINGGAGIRVMCRLDFEGTFPRPTFTVSTASGGLGGRIRADRRSPHYSIGAGWFDDAEWGLDWNSQATLDMFSGEHPETPAPNHANGGLSMSDPETLMRLGADFNHPDWNRVLDQMTTQDLYDLIQRGGYMTAPIANINLTMRWNLDGPSGLNFGNQSVRRTAWTAFPVSTVVAQTWNRRLAFFKGLAVGEEAGASGVGAWYAPGVNLHRGAFASRNFEYYSECPRLTGIIAAYLVEGALQNGLYCYVKHFVANDSETHRGGIRTWMTEQTLRELYLKPFEITVRYGRASGMMSGFNMLGALWTGGSRSMNTYILRNEWGFRGAMVTDYFDGGGGANHMSASQGLRAGNDLWLSGVEGSAGGGIDGGGNWLPAGSRGSQVFFATSDRTGAATHTNTNANVTRVGRIVMRNGAKNILFSIANSYWFANVLDDETLNEVLEERFGEEVINLISNERSAIIEGEEGPMPWWVWLVLVVVNVLLIGGLLVLLFFHVVKYFIKKSRQQGEPAVE